MNDEPPETKTLIEQPSYLPTRKVSMGQFAASIVTICAWGIETYTHIAIPLFIGTAFLQIVIGIVQYMTWDRI